MTKASDNLFPKVLIVEGAAPSSPSSGDQALFIDSADHHVKRKNSGGTVTDIEAAGSGMTNPMTNAGDIIIGGTAGAPAQLVKGSDSTVLTIDPSTHIPAWDALPYPALTTQDATFTTSVAIPGTSTYTDVVSITLAAGTWDLYAYLDINLDTLNSTSAIYLQMTDNSNTQIAQVMIQALGSSGVPATVEVTCHVQVSGGATYKMRGASGSVDAHAYGTTAMGTGGGSKIHAVRVA